MLPRIPLGKFREELLSEQAHVATLDPKSQQDYYRNKDEARRKAALSMNLAELNLSVRTVNALDEFGIQTVAQLIKYNGKQLKESVRNFGDNALQEVYRALEEAGLRRKNRN